MERKAGTDDTDINARKDRLLKIADGMVYTGWTMTIGGFISFAQLDHGPLSPLESCGLIIGGLVIWRTGEYLHEKVALEKKI